MPAELGLGLLDPKLGLEVVGEVGEVEGEVGELVGEVVVAGGGGRFIARRGGAKAAGFGREMSRLFQVPGEQLMVEFIDSSEERVGSWRGEMVKEREEGAAGEERGGWSTVGAKGGAVGAKGVAVGAREWVEE